VTRACRERSAQDSETGGARPNGHPTLRQGLAPPPHLRMHRGWGDFFVAGGDVAPDAMANATPSAEGDSVFRRATLSG